MCFFKCHSNKDLIRHYVRCHKDPQFRIPCEECGATFRKWKSFTQHCKRHLNSVQTIDNVDQNIENLAEEENNNILMEQQNPFEKDDKGKIINL